MRTLAFLLSFSVCTATLLRSQTITTVYSFGLASQSQTKPSYPLSTLTEISPGVFFGTTETGGKNECGTIFSITATGAYKKVHDMAPIEGCLPTGQLVAGPESKLYGTTLGSPFDPDRNSALFTTDLQGNVSEVVSFTAAVHSQYILEAQPPTIASDGSIYVVVNQLEASLGVEFFTVGCFVYHYAPGDTSGIVGQLRSGATTPPLTLADDGNLYGVAALAGGTEIFRVSATGITSLATIPDTQSYSYSLAIAQGADGNLYAVDNYRISSVDLTGANVKLVQNFAASDNCNASTPSTGLTLAKDGSLYGGCAGLGFGPTNQASIYKISPDGEYGDVASFPAGTGQPASASGLAVQASDGLLYGIINSTDIGGREGLGAVYTLNLRQ